MFDYIKGKITEVSLDKVVIENQNIGFILFVPNPSDFNYGVEEKVFTYFHVREDGMSLFGFKRKEEKDLFLKLIEVSGIGPKTACNILGATTYSALIQAIETSNTAFLKKLPGIGAKAASQIVLDLKGKLVIHEQDKKVAQKLSQELQDTRDALKGLGFKAGDIDAVLAKIGNEEKTSGEYLREALKMLRK